MPAPRLVDSCIKVCIRNVRSLTDVGDFEYCTIRPVLKCVPSAEQLHVIETNSPQIRGDDAELWRAFISRDIPNWRTKNYTPKNPLKWYEIYCKYKKEQRAEIERDEEILKKSMLGIKREKETHVSRVVDLRTLPKIPRDPRMLANNGGVPLGKSKGPQFRKEGASALSWTGGSKTKLTDGKSVLTRARREAKEISQMSKLSRPTAMLSGRLGQVKQAPAGMIKEYKVAAQPPIKILTKTRKLTEARLTGGISGPSLEDRERRLRAAMAGGSGSGSKRDSVKQTMVGSSDEEASDDDAARDYEDDEEESTDLFGESSKSRISSSRLPPKSTSSTTQPAREALSSSPSRDLARTSSPAPGGQGGGPPKSMIVRKRPQVDIFNRGKKPRLR